MASKTEKEILEFLERNKGEKMSVSELAVAMGSDSNYTWINEKVKGLILQKKLKSEVAECVGKDGKTRLCRKVWV